MSRRKNKDQLSFNFSKQAGGFQLLPSPQVVVCCKVCGYAIWERQSGEAKLVRVGKHGDCWGGGKG